MPPSEFPMGQAVIGTSRSPMRSSARHQIPG